MLWSYIHGKGRGTNLAPSGHTHSRLFFQQDDIILRRELVYSSGEMEDWNAKDWIYIHWVGMKWYTTLGGEHNGR